MLKIVAACGNGMGSSLMVKLKIESVCQEMGIDAHIDHMSIGDAKNVYRNYDIIMCSQALLHNFSQLENIKVIGLRNLLSTEEIKEKFIENDIK